MILHTSHPLIVDCVRILKGAPYAGPLGHPAFADCDGLLLVQAGTIICDERITQMLSDRWKFKRRK